MADLSKIKLNGELYNFKDAEARQILIDSNFQTEDDVYSAIYNSAGRLIPYGYCQTAAATVEKTVAVSPEPIELATGLIIAVKFQYANTGSDPTLNVNNLGAIAIKRYGTTAAGTSAAANWNANSVVILTYDGTYWQLVDWNNTTYSGMSDAEVTAGTGTSNRLITPARLKTAIQTWAPSIPENISAFTNDAGYLTSYTETDPTVPAWAKAETKPTYTASEVGAAESAHTHDTLQTTVGSNNTEYNLIGTATSNTNTTAVNIYNPTSISFAKTTNEGRLTLGSSSLPGKIRLYSNVINATGYTDLISGTTSTNTNTITFPDNTGTVALTTDIPSVPSWAMQSSKPSYTFSELTSHPTTINDYGIIDVYTKTEVDGLISGVLHYKGTKANTNALPSSGNIIGDVWHITTDGSEWAWDGAEWQELGSTVDLTGYLQTEDIATWAKAANKPSYTANEVGALPSNTTYVSTFNGQSGAITYIPPVTSVNGQTGAVTLNIPAAQVQADWNATSGMGVILNKPTIPVAYDDTALAARVQTLENIPWVTYYTGTSEPSNSQGQNGDIYLQTD